MCLKTLQRIERVKHSHDRKFQVLWSLKGSIWQIMYLSSKCILQKTLNTCEWSCQVSFCITLNIRTEVYCKDHPLILNCVFNTSKIGICWFWYERTCSNDNSQNFMFLLDRFKDYGCNVLISTSYFSSCSHLVNKVCTKLM